MADPNRNQNQNRDKQQGSSSQPSGSRQQANSPRRDDDNEVQQTKGNRRDHESMTDDEMTGSGSSGTRGGSTRGSQSIADDRGMDADRSRRNFSADRESDELGSEMSDEDRDDTDDLDGSGGRSNR